MKPILLVSAPFVVHLQKMNQLKNNSSLVMVMKDGMKMMSSKNLEKSKLVIKMFSSLKIVNGEEIILYYMYIFNKVQDLGLGAA